jgi:predicted Zn-dependent protease
LVVLVPEGVADPAGPVRLVNRAVAAGPENYAYAYTLGAALYRAGQFADAARQLTAADKMRKQGGSGHCWLFLAMAHHRLGNAAEAKKWLAKAVTWNVAKWRTRPFRHRKWLRGKDLYQRRDFANRATLRGERDPRLALTPGATFLGNAI